VKGVVLAGGLATRLYPVTKVVNKHLLDVFDEPMIYYPIKALARTGVTDVVVVTAEEALQGFRRLLGDGDDVGVKISYASQESGDLGISDAIARAEPLVNGEPIVCILGDNIFQEDLTPYVKAFQTQDKGAKILLKHVGSDDAHRFGIAEILEGKIAGIEEKPADPKSDLAVTGCYMFDDRVFEFVRTLTPSGRGELEVTDLNNIYIEEGTMTYDVLSGWWTDAGTPASKLKASILVALEKGVTFHR
jgi:glucose-1-phosphate thymidylyltransferase